MFELSIIETKAILYYVTESDFYVFWFSRVDEKQKNGKNIFICGSFLN